MSRRAIMKVEINGEWTDGSSYPPVVAVVLEKVTTGTQKLLEITVNDAVKVSVKLSELKLALQALEGS
jgi:hypothetical protein